MPDIPPMPPIDAVNFDDLSAAEQEAALDRLFGSSGVGGFARDVFLGLSAGDVPDDDRLAAAGVGFGAGAVAVAESIGGLCQAGPKFC
jgi:hypothetical protein